MIRNNTQPTNIISRILDRPRFSMHSIEVRVHPVGRRGVHLCTQ